MGLDHTGNGFPTINAQAIAGRIVRLMVVVAQSTIEQESPGGKGGRVAEWLSQAEDREQANGWIAYVGPLNPLRMDSSAPANTLNDFLDWYRGARRKGGKNSPMYHARPWPGAWYFLKDDEKQALEAARASGLYGGPPIPPLIIGAWDQGRVPKPSKSTSLVADTRYKDFLEKILDRAHTAIESVMQNLDQADPTTLGGV